MSSSPPSTIQDIKRSLAAGRVAIAGLGGLGSHVAVALARCGVGRLLLVDFDSVDETNISRQVYLPKHIGMLKTAALTEIISEINPSINIEAINVRLTAANIRNCLAGWPVIVEAFDLAENKAELVNTALESFPDTRIVCGSGLAGFESANKLASRKIGSRLYICGDEESGIGGSMVLMAPRVMVCAGHQANMVVRILLGQMQP